MVDKDAYTLRISRADTAGLVVIALELAADFIGDALTRHSDRDEYCEYLDKAKNAVLQLIRGLNFEVSMAQDFFDIYRYLYKLLVDAFFNGRKEPAAEALSLIETLLAGWREAASIEAAAAPAIAESSKVFAGLTYERGGLSEYVERDESKGFKA
jgi:flagellin-specific chaperone FliS